VGRLTRPADPLGRDPGIGFEGGGANAVHVGARIAFGAYLIGDTPSSRATITGVTVPRIPGLRLRLYAVSGRPHGAGIVRVAPRRTDRDSIGANELVPVVGRSLAPTPAGFDSQGRRALTVALVEEPLSPGCYSISGVSIRYRVGDSTFTKRMDGRDLVSTSRHGCDASLG
jgi:hypothetical protein